MDNLETRERILAVASRLYAEHGYNGMSLRALTQEAGVNLAAVNYHFGSKQQLIYELFRYHTEPLNLERLRLLDEALIASGGLPLSLEAIASSLVRPMEVVAHHHHCGCESFLKGMARFMGESDDFMYGKFLELFSEMATRFEHELSRSLPLLDASDIRWRFQLAVSSMIGTFLRQGLFVRLGMMPASEASTQQLLDRLIRYIAAGLRS